MSESCTSVLLVIYTSRNLGNVRPRFAVRRSTVEDLQKWRLVKSNRAARGRFTGTAAFVEPIDPVPEVAVENAKLVTPFLKLLFKEPQETAKFCNANRYKFHGNVSTDSDGLPFGKNP